MRTENIPKEAPKKSKYGDVEMRDADDDADEADDTAQTATVTLSDSEVGDEVGEVDVADSSAETMKGEPTLEMYENEMKRLKEREEKLKKKMFAMRPDVNYETMAEVEEGWLLSGSRPDPRASERTGPRVMCSANPKYRIRTADGKYVIPETVDSTAGPRPEVILDDFDNPAGEQMPGTKMTKAERLAAEAEAIRIAEIKEKEAAERAKREAAAKSSIMETELKFYRDTTEVGQRVQRAETKRGRQGEDAAEADDRSPRAGRDERCARQRRGQLSRWRRQHSGRATAPGGVPRRRRGRTQR